MVSKYFTKGSVFLELRKKMLLLIAIVSTPLIAFSVFAPRFLFRDIRVSYELGQTLLNNVSLDVSLEDTKIIDSLGHWANMYVKLELLTEEFERLKRNFIKTGGAAYNKDFPHDPKYFESHLSIMKNVKKMYGYKSMSIDNYNELFILMSVRGKLIPFATTSEIYYVLIKENSGNCYLYICA